MALDIKTLTKSAVAVLFGLGGDLVKDGTYYRPPSYNPATGQVVTAEVVVACKIFVAVVPLRQFGPWATEPRYELVLIRASELVGISLPAQGDYIVQADGTRRDVVNAPRLDPSGELWSFDTQRSLDDDWGDLTAHSSSEDWGDLTAATAFEERGALF